jgi:hypothetical protein
MQPVKGSMNTEQRLGSALTRSHSRFVCTDLVPDTACGGVNVDSGEKYSRSAISILVPDLSVLTSFQIRPVEGSMKTEGRSRSAVCVLVPNLSVLTSFQMLPVEGSMKTEERPGSALARSRSRIVCIELVPYAACGGVNEDRGEAWVSFSAFLFQICLY